jgi:predicted 2-oxoglutarate/Fe(II)-dependent dioxygenase YbiX
MNELIFYDYVYNKTAINEIKKICDCISWKRASDLVNSNDGNRYTCIVDNMLDSDELIQSYLNFLPEYVSVCLNEGFITSGGYTPDVKLSKYEINDQYGWHCDGWEKNISAPIWKREISSITYLNDDFEGGETEFSSGLVIKPQTGKTLIFPSNWNFPHKGNIVTKGTKYIYVNHIWV